MRIAHYNSETSFRSVDHLNCQRLYESLVLTHHNSTSDITREVIFRTISLLVSQYHLPCSYNSVFWHRCAWLHTDSRICDFSRLKSRLIPDLILFTSSWGNNPVRYIGALASLTEPQRESSKPETCLLDLLSPLPFLLCLSAAWQPWSSPAWWLQT